MSIKNGMELRNMQVALTTFRWAWSAFAQFRIIDYAAILSDTSGLTSMTMRMRSSTTLFPDFSPSFLMSAKLFSASLLASSSAFLLPLECCK